MLFSVIIPTYNRAALLQLVLNSIFAQEFNDFEVIVVDDGSTDETWERLLTWGERVRALRHQNAGPGPTRNLGAQKARGEYLAFLDSDDLWFPWSLQVYQQLIEKHRRPAFLAGKPFQFSNSEELLAIAGGEAESLSFPDYYASGDEMRWWSASSFVVRRDAFEAAGKFTSECVNGEDADLALRLGVAHGFVQVTSPATFAYREHGVSAMKNFSKTLAGTRLALSMERSGRYPGGKLRARERRQILTRHARPVSLECLRCGMREEAWELYHSIFRWHVELGRWKYLAGFPLKAACARLR